MNRHYFVMSVVLVLLFVSACGTKAPQEPLTQPGVVNEPTTVSASATPEPQVPPDTPVSGATEQPLSEITEAPKVITHVDYPGTEAAIDWSQEIRDCSTGDRVALGVTTIVGSGCDDWSIARIERPVMAYNDTFIPALDINRAYMGESLNWFYASIRLHSTAAGNLPSDLVVALELDTDVDSRGDLLIIASNIGTEWSTDGVQIWNDANGDVGGNQPMRPDGAAGDGYEVLIFDAGVGYDPDLAWARVSPANGATIEIAFKDDLMPANGVYAWWVWTSLGGFDPARMEIVDALNPEETWLMDNTCGWIFGAKPSSILRNLCEIITPTPTPTPIPTAAQVNNPQPTSCPYYDLVPGVQYCTKQMGYSSYWDNQKCKCLPLN